MKKLVVKNDTISLSKFLSRYAGLSGEHLSKLTHEDVKVLFPNLKRTSFEKINNDFEYLDQNEGDELEYSDIEEVIYVNDGRRTLPYIIPDTIAEDYDEIQCEEFKDINEVDYNSYDYSKLSTYELKLLLRHAFSSYKNQRCARQELNNRGIVKKKYNRNDFKNENYD